MSHYAGRGENEREFIRKHVSKEPAPDSCLCKAHQTEAKQMWTNPNYIPKWQSCGTACEAMKYTTLMDYCAITQKTIKQLDSLGLLGAFTSRNTTQL